MNTENRNNNIGREESGFTDDLMGEVVKGINSMSSAKFTNITPLYTSKSGHAMLLRAERYGKRYALKCLKEEYRYSPMFRMALRKEFEIGIGMEHPNIVQTIGFEEVDGYGQAIVLEYIDGITLGELLERGDVSVRKGRSIVGQIADAMGYLHSKQVVHRDIKPSNIMVTHIGGNVKLIDFSLSDSETFSVIKMQACTRSYMAPELGNPDEKSTAKTDIYSFGLVVRDLAGASGDKKLLAVSRLCTKKNPDERPSDIAELAIPSGNGASRSGLSIFSLDSPALTWILAALAVLLAILIVLGISF